MLWCILIGVGLVIIIIGFSRAISNKVDFSSSSSLIWAGFATVFISLIVGIIFSVGNAGDYEFSEEPVLKETTEIYTLADRYSVKGNFFLGSGSISSEDYYYYIKDTDKGKITDKIPQKDTFITEDNSQKPRIEEYAYKGERNASKDFWLSIDFGENKEDFSYNTAYYRVFIPKNTIKTDFAVDLN